MGDDPVRRLIEIGRDISNVRLPTLPQSFHKAAFVCVNAYESYRLGEGKGPLSDAVSFVKMFKSYGYEVFFIISPNAKNYLQYFDTFLEKTQGRLIILYLGHETYKTEESDQEEAFLFNDGAITNSVLIDHIVQKKQDQAELILITDSCHPGSVWNIKDGKVNGIKLPPKIISISAVNLDDVYELNSVQARLIAGEFTKSIVKTLKNNSGVTLLQLQKKLEKQLQQYNQKFVVGTTSSELLNTPLFLIQYQ